jgi:NADH dehydrogenase
MKIIIAGGGFAGVKCARKLAGLKGHDIVLINRTEHTTMLPSLPDLAGGRIRKEYLMGSIRHLIPKNVRLAVETIQEIDLEKNTVTTDRQNYPYDSLMIAGGARTNFYGFNQNLDQIRILESIENAEKIRTDILQKVSDGSLKEIVIAGAGFTGLELGASLHDLLKDHPEVRISFVEKTETVISPQNPRMSQHVRESFDKMGIRFYMKESIKSYDQGTITLESGREFKDAMLIWCCGLMRSINIKGKIETTPNGRILVDEYLRVRGYKNVFAGGDAAAFSFRDKILRMSVNYAEMMGKLAGKNIRRLIKNQLPDDFNPIDPGWVLPIYFTSTGYAAGLKVGGKIGMILHYLISGMKNYSLKNFLAYLGYAIRFIFLSCDSKEIDLNRQSVF